MTGPRWLLAVVTVLSLGLLASPVLAQLCVVDPISPLCCPSPCPVFDAARVPKLLADVETLGNAVRLDAQVVRTATQIGQSIGDAKAVAAAMNQQLSSFAGTLSGEVTAIQTGLSATPAQALAGLKKSLIEPVGVASTGTQSAARRSARLAAVQGEQTAAFATSLMRSKALPSLAPQQSRIAGTVSGTQQLQGDMAANSASRLALYQDVGAIHQLVAAWVAQRSTQAAIAHPAGAGDTATPQMSDASGSASTSPAPVNQTTAGAIDALVTLHDARVAAQTLLSAYPGLQQTIASANLASQFAIQAETALQQSLDSAGLSATSLSDIENSLTTLDATDWLDSTKAVAARQAASKVSAVLLAGRGFNDGGAALQQLQTALIAWGDANKQSLYWADLANQARQGISTLDASLGALSDQAGVDVTGPAGAAREKVLLARLSLDPGSTQWKPLLATAAHDPSAHSVLNYAGAR